MRTVCHRIAEIVFRTESEFEIPQLCRNPFARFEVHPDTPPDVLLRFFRAGTESESSALASSAGLAGELAKCLRLSLLQAFEDQIPSERLFRIEQDQLIIRDFKSHSLAVISRSKIGGYGAGIHLAANLRLHFSAFLPQFDAMAIHSGGIIRNGHALLLVAPDEGGKTTAVQLARGCPILHDDQVILRRCGGVVHAHATPFGILTDGANSARLGAIFFLEQSPDFSIEPVHRREVFRCLWHGHSSFLDALPRKEKIQAFDLMQAVSSQVPAYHMRFAENWIDWGAVDQVLEGR